MSASAAHEIKVVQILNSRAFATKTKLPLLLLHLPKLSRRGGIKNLVRVDFAESDILYDKRKVFVANLQRRTKNKHRERRRLCNRRGLSVIRFSSKQFMKQASICDATLVMAYWRLNYRLPVRYIAFRTNVVKENCSLTGVIVVPGIPPFRIQSIVCSFALQPPSM